ncbi:TPA: VWA domain-containing protein [Escherichia coli]
MSELNDLLTTRELQRWRLILGEAAETTLCGLDDNARQIDHALEWLYGRDPERLQRGERSGGLGGSNLTTPEWINSIHTLFPQQVKKCVQSCIKVLGLAALDSTATPCYDHDTAQALVNVGAQIAAMTPGELASWLAENLQS